MGTFLVIVASLLLLLVLIFLLQRVARLEEAARGIGQSSTKAVASNDPIDRLFSKYDGQALWDLLASQSTPNDIEPQLLEEARQRYSFILLAHATRLFESGARGLSESPGNAQRIVTMRGAVQSWLPQTYAVSLFECGRQSRAANDEASREPIRQRLLEISQAMAPALQAGVLLQLSDRLLPRSAPASGTHPDMAA
jgi:hypothetical protein